MKRISTKIILTIIACSVAIASIIGSVSILKCNDIVDKESNEKLLYLTESYTKDMSYLIGDIESKVDGLSTVVANTFSLEQLKGNPRYFEEYDKQLAGIVRDYAEAANGAMSAYIFFNPELINKAYDIYFADTKGDRNFERQVMLAMDAYNPAADDMGWFYNTIIAKKGLWTDPFLYSALNIKMMTYTKPVYIDGIFVGIVGCDVNFDSLKNTVNGIKIYKTGYAFMLNDKYDYIVHPTLTEKDNLRTLQGGAYKNMAESIDKKATDVLLINFGGTVKRLGFSHLSNGYVLAITIPESEILAELNKTKRGLIYIVILCIVVSGVIAYLIGRLISKPIVCMSEIINKVANLDLTPDDKYRFLFKYKDETGIMFNAINQMKDALSKKVHTLSLNARDTMQHAENLAAITGESVSSIEQISNAVDELAKASNDQAEQAQKGSESLNCLSNEINTVTKSSEEMSSYANETSDVNGQGKRIIEQLQGKFQANTEQAMVVAKKIDILANKSGNISNIVETIQKIAAQTNLLALNAAIEAARAGELGKGFAVVSEEIRKLAEETEDSTRKIANIIGEIRSEIDSTKEAMDKTKVIVESANGGVFDVENAFSTISVSVRKTIDKIQGVVSGMQVMQVNKDSIIATIQEISAVSQESAASTEEIAASLEEQAAGVKTLAKTAGELRTIADVLQSTIGDFKL